MGFSYEGDGKEEAHLSDADDNDDDGDEDDDEDFNSDDSNDEEMDIIAKEFGVKRYGWLVYMDKKAKEEEKRQKEVIKGDPAIVSLSQWLVEGVSFVLLCSTVHAFYSPGSKILIFFFFFFVEEAES